MRTRSSMRRSWRFPRDTRMASSSLLLALTISSAAAAADPSTSSTDTITRLAFGSCNKQHLPQPMWSAVEELSPDVWLWIGDAVYVDKHSDGGVEKEYNVLHGNEANVKPATEGMKEAIGDQLANKDYQRFLSKVPRVDGVWDDHDYGVNDAGKELVDHPGRVDAFLDFLGAGPDDPRRGGATLYSSHVFGNTPRKVKVVLLDVRTKRDKYNLFNISGKRFKFAAMLGAMLRWLSSSLCLGSDYDGAVIGDDQFEWLEEQLTDSDASVHVLVSSLQMLTSNPLVESWGHFPQSRDRMLSLLRRTNPAGLVILSGDVHHAEFAAGWKQSSVTSEASSTAATSASESAAELSADRDRSDREPRAMPPGHEEMVREAKAKGTSGCPFGRSSGASLGSGDNSGCAAALAGGAKGAKRGRGVVEVTTSGMTHSCLSSHGKKLCEAYLKRWQEHRWRNDAYYLDTNFGDIEIEWAEEGAAQPAKMAVTVRDTHGKPILPVVEYFGDEERHRQASEQAVDTTEAAIQEGEQGRDPGRERTFLERSPPPECVEPVLPGGCTMRKLSVVFITSAAMVLSCVGICSGPGRGRKAKSRPTVKNGHANGKSYKNGTRISLRNGRSGTAKAEGAG